MSFATYSKIGETDTTKYGTTEGKLFGKHCLKVKDKAFAAFFREEMVFKIGQEDALIFKEKYPGSQNWDPSGKGRPMKDWLQVPAEFDNNWEELAEKALSFTEG